MRLHGIDVTAHDGSEQRAALGCLAFALSGKRDGENFSFTCGWRKKERERSAMSAEAIAKLLRANVISAKPAVGSAQTAADDLRVRVEHKLARLLAGDDEGRKGWGGVLIPGGVRDNFQLHVCKWSDIRAFNLPPRVKYDATAQKGGDSAGPLDGEGRFEWPMDAAFACCVNDYFYALLRGPDAPLATLGGLLDEIDEEYVNTHRVVLSIDFYYARPLTQLGLHKDTTGTTLFVGLHYDNDADMAGPEYIYDLWPIPGPNDDYPDDGSFIPRLAAPWAWDETSKVQFWPKDLLDGLKQAREQLKAWRKNADLLSIATVPRNGLVTFVDELIYHQTPLTRRRTRGDEKTSLRSALVASATA